MANERTLATIRMTNMIFYGYHGTSAAEKETGRRFEVDCEIVTDIAKAARNDSLENTIDYTRVYNVIEDLLHNNRYNLIETLAERLADAVFNTFDIERLKIRVRKRIPPVPGNIDSLEVETQRSK